MGILMRSLVSMTACLMSTAHAGSQSTTMQITAEVVSSCSLSAGNMDFGSGTFSELGFLSRTEATIVVSCPQGQSWSVSMDGGLHAGGAFPSSGFREMHHSSGATSTSGAYQYEITYTDVDQNLFDQLWGDGVNFTFGPPRTGSGSKSMIAVGTIQTPTINLPYGVYSDVVTVTLDY